MVKIAIDTEEKVSNLIYWRVRNINEAGEISLDVKKNTVWNFDLAVYKKDGIHARGRQNLTYEEIIDKLEVITATLDGVK